MQLYGVDVELQAATDDQATVVRQASSSLLQAADTLRSGARQAGLPDDVLLEQGRLSAASAAAAIAHLLPNLSGLMLALCSPGARMTDVGTGTAARAIAYARA